MPYQIPIDFEFLGATIRRTHIDSIVIWNLCNCIYSSTAVSSFRPRWPRAHLAPVDIIDVKVPRGGPGDHQHRPRFPRPWRPDSKSGRNRRVLVPARADVRQHQACDDKKPDYAFAPVVYGGPNGVLAQLLEPRRGLRSRRMRSILLQSGKSSGMQMKLVDFAHVSEGDGSRRWQFLGRIVGLCSLLSKFLFHILTDHEAGQLGLGQSLVKLREH